MPRSRTRRLATYAEPTIGSLPVHAIDTALVMQSVGARGSRPSHKPATALWKARPETASRPRGRASSPSSIGQECAGATVRRGHLDKLLPARTKVRGVEHHAALPFRELPDFMTELRKPEGVAARVLEFAILTAVHSSFGASSLKGNVTAVRAVDADASKRRLERPDGIRQMVSRRNVLGNVGDSRRKLLKHVGKQPVMHVDVNGFLRFRRARSLQDQGDAARIEGGFKSGRAFERPAVKLVGIFEGNFGYPRSASSSAPLQFASCDSYLLRRRFFLS